MVKLRKGIDDREKARQLKSVNQGASCFTDFFDSRNEFNENPAEPINELARNSKVDIMGRRIK